MNVEPTSEPTPDLDEVKQYQEQEALLKVPVSVESIGPVQVHTLPARDASMREIFVNDTTQQIVGLNLRRQKVSVWATAPDASTYVYIGSDKNQVESGTAARLPAPVDTYADGMPMVLTMTHTLQMWVKAAAGKTAQLSIVTEDWAD